ncbi:MULTISPECIES: cysteine-rich CWC family protein [Shewanella]|uniref:Cysteine-rich CWC family protein n=1 Tax=Shewanella marisflavi TaxID=260364 RepID=A0ABX5WI04_9GAMM|nr:MULTISPECIES: cysteine-rich CWC family protein [Shewanella]MCL1041515.1 cysteine-rich CWC family protein [Shewanella marisflavi]QDF74102.1 cysteine-rich CWC family protein [Shewanella marisflavi]
MNIKASICPLCQQPNACAMAAKRQIETCWCQQQVFVPKHQLALDNLAPERCICQVCAEALKQEALLGVRRVDK